MYAVILRGDSSPEQDGGICQARVAASLRPPRGDVSSGAVCLTRPETRVLSETNGIVEAKMGGNVSLCVWPLTWSAWKEGGEKRPAGLGRYSGRTGVK